MRLTFRTTLIAIVGIAAFAFLLLTATGVVLTKRAALQLATIQTRYIPKVELEPQLYAQFDRIVRGFQDAVAIRDVEGLSTTNELKQRFLGELEAAGAAVDAADAEALRLAIEDYQTTAGDVSRRLIAGETGEALVDALTTMQSKQVRVQSCINKAAALDRRELTHAFAAAAYAQSMARLYQGLISISCLAAVLAVSLLLSRSVLRSMAELTQGLERFGHGDFRQPIQVKTRDELGEVAARANAMAANLERSDKERERAETALRLSNKELEAFSYSVAHDLRAPLRGINGLSKVLMEDYGDRLNDEARDYLDRIAAGAQRMGTLIDALLSLARVTRTELHRETVDVSRLAEAVVHQLRQNQPDRVVEFVNEPGVEAHADPALLRAVLENLLGNAWKFTGKRERAQIAFGWELMGSVQVYYVRDNGAGFDMAYAEKLFAPFQRLHTSVEFVGTGVGLATVQRIVNRHGGRIWADGVVGEGATFRFTLPSSAEDPIS
jgi:signal transduction histidine kinase